MLELNLALAEAILDAALARAIEHDLNPVAVAVLDSRGCTKVLAAQDGVSLLRTQIAHAKAFGALAMGMGSRGLYVRAQEQTYFVGAVNTLAGGQLVPVPGGVLIYADRVLLGAVGVSGDSSDNDEMCAVAAIESAGLQADTG
ncbi:GlcG/HbpS family heme-binding protein [Mycobacterium palustre]|uniref:Glcg protein n=1 Tax=Mycobacterium palustre TaxID=153971 RepID=A0A1X1ZEZ5_9MYCO|nr:heme-binding protein [Mycobacterium palustre]MCV7101365.1 heme-binding protein [Mycobacterium palustre]ORW21987.1 glcg protein [Mycobacterium palustre]